MLVYRTEIVQKPKESIKSSVAKTRFSETVSLGPGPNTAAFLAGAMNSGPP